MNLQVICKEVHKFTPFSSELNTNLSSQVLPIPFSKNDFLIQHGGVGYLAALYVGHYISVSLKYKQLKEQLQYAQWSLTEAFVSLT